MTTTLIFIGSGNVGTTIARLAVEAGHHVVLGNSRGAGARGHGRATGAASVRGDSTEAATAREIVVVSVPVMSFPHLPAAALAGRTLIDTCNYGPRARRAHRRARHRVAHLERAAAAPPPRHRHRESLQHHLLHPPALARPPGSAPDRSYLPIAGNSAPAKAAVTELVESIGYCVVDAGSLADSWRQATGTPVWGTPYGPSSDEKGQPAGVDAIRAALADATHE